MNIESINEITNHLVKVVETAPAWVSAVVLFFATWIEYIFPPFPGDTILVAGGFFAARGAISLYVTFTVLVLGSTTGCIDRKSTRLNSSHSDRSRMPSSA